MVAASSTRKRTSRASNAAKAEADLAPSAASVRTPTKKNGKPASASVKKEEEPSEDVKVAQQSPAQKLSAKKLQTYAQHAVTGPFPGFDYPSVEEAEKVAALLAEWHGYKKDEQGKVMLPRHRKPTGNDFAGGCGNVPNVLDALIRTVLSCNTSNRNSAAAHRSLVARFGDCNFQAMLDAPHQDLVDSIKCGGLANNKGKTIRGILEQTNERHGKLSLDHLHSPDVTDSEIINELLSFPGVGPKVATCVSMFCIGRQTMAVDTHVWRLSKMLGWVPEKATRDQTCYHLEERLPGTLKYPLHVLLIKHGKMCRHCSARGFATVELEDGTSEEEEEEETKVKAEKGDDLEEDEGLVKPEEQDAESKKKRKDRPCPLRQHGLIHKRTYSKKAAAGANGTSKAKAEPVSPSKVKKEPASPSKGRKRVAKQEPDVQDDKKKVKNEVKAQDEEDVANTSARRSSRKRVKTE